MRMAKVSRPQHDFKSKAEKIAKGMHSTEAATQMSSKTLPYSLETQS